jgi:hypothetical protein
MNCLTQVHVVMAMVGIVAGIDYFAGNYPPQFWRDN